MNWDVDDRKKLKKFVCIICEGIISDPVQSYCCGVRLCLSCCVRENCPKCGQKLKYFTDKAFLRECNTLMVSCPRQCGVWNGLISSLQGHLEINCVSNILQDDPSESASNGPRVTEAISLQSYSHNDDLSMVSGSSEGARFVTPSSVVIDRDDQYKVLCGSCGEFVMWLKLEEHKSTCYKLQKYKCMCYSYKKPIFEEIKSCIGPNEMVTGCPSTKFDFPQVSCVQDPSLSRSIQLQNDKMLENVKTVQQFVSPIDIPHCRGTRWKVSDISIRSKDSKHSGIRSSRFYSSVNGYCLRLGLLFGKKQDKLLVLLQDGENDATLNFPFRGQVDIGILSFTSSGGIHRKSVPCEAAQCFSEYGNSIATSLAIPILNGSNFVKDDDIFINCTVQTDGL